MSKSDKLRIPEYLRHILEAIQRIERYTEDMTETGFLAGEMVQDAVRVKRRTTSASITRNLPRSTRRFPGRISTGCGTEWLMVTSKWTWNWSGKPFERICRNWPSIYAF